jgi:hypothetical protein
VSIPPGGTQKFQITYTETGVHDTQGPLLQFDTNDPSGSQFISLSGTVAGDTGLKQHLATNPTANCGFGVVTLPDSRTITVQLFNVGLAPLNISGITLTSGSSDFTLTPAPTFPIQIAPGAESDITIQFLPTGSGDRTAEFTIVSDDPRSPFKITASGTGNIPTSGPMAEFLRFLGISH